MLENVDDKPYGNRKS